MKLNIETLKS